MRQAVRVKVRIAVSPGGSPADPSSLATVIDGLEARGFDTIWLSDVPMGPLVDPLLGLAFAAARTSRLKLGANVVPFGRSPYVLAKELAQLDQLSSGRLLLSLVPGLDQHGEREALTIGRRRRGQYLDELIPMLRRWWAGEAVDHHSEAFECAELTLPARPVQQPLEIWLGGVGPAAIDRAGRLSDGWLGANLNPAEAGIAARRIGQIAADANHEIDPEHPLPSRRAERRPARRLARSSPRWRSHRHRPARRRCAGPRADDVDRRGSVEVRAPPRRQGR
jgi:probable F420-dependent oxidoreductase